MASHSHSSTSGFSKIKTRFIWTLQSACAVALAAFSSQYHIYQNTYISKHMYVTVLTKFEIQTSFLMQLLAANNI